MYNFIDVEASGFGSGSYPIEIGVALADGRGKCTLIRPEEHWTHWSQDAEKLHQISRETLLIKGRSPLNAAMLLNEWLDGKTVYSDAWGNDSCWVAMLFEQAGLHQRFKIDSVVSLMSASQMDRWHEVKQDVAERMKLGRHRASADALVLQKTLEAMALADAV